MFSFLCALYKSVTSSWRRMWNTHRQSTSLHVYTVSEDNNTIHYSSALVMKETTRTNNMLCRRVICSQNLLHVRIQSKIIIFIERIAFLHIRML